MTVFGARLKEARKAMGWDQRSLAKALRMSDRTIWSLENTGSPDLPAAQDVLDLMKAYEVKFGEDYSFVEPPAPEHRYFLTLDFRFQQNPDKHVNDIARQMRVVGMSVVRRFNKARETASMFDGVELHAPPVNRESLDTVLANFLDELDSPIGCFVRNRFGMQLTPSEIPNYWSEICAI